MELDKILMELVFGPHNTTTILMLTLSLVYFGILVPRPTHKRAQDLNDSKTKTIELLLDGYKGDLEDIREAILRTESSREELREVVVRLEEGVEKLNNKERFDGFTDESHKNISGPTTSYDLSGESTRSKRESKHESP